MSGLPFELLLALRYLRPKRTFVSVITLISVAGVALGVAVLVIVISVMSGFDQQMRETIFGINAHLKVLARPDDGARLKSMADYSAVMRIIQSNRNVVGVAPYVLEQVFVKTEPREGEAMAGAPWLRGIEPRYETNVSVLPSSIIEGVFDVERHGERHSLLVGKVFADSMDLRVGDRVNIFSPRDLERIEKSRGKEVPAPDEYYVRGIFDVGYYEFNASVVVTSLEDAQDLYDLGDNVAGLMVTLRDPFAAFSVAKEVSAALGPKYSVTTWEQDSPLLAAVMVE